jgi:5-methylcytosine-specific restriction endonuclease McrBC regulatory subunit McrC
VAQVAEADFYQLNAYAEMFTTGEGDAALIYPRWGGFEDAIGPLTFRPSGKRLWIVPFDLENDCLGLQLERSAVLA